MSKVAIIGRTNVGKSTLFNRLLGQKKAITSPLSGTTRDRNFGQCLWNGKKFTLIDTGGLQDPAYKKYSTKTEKEKLLDIEENVKKQALIALKQADIIVFVLDFKDSILPQDKEIAGLLRKSKKPITLAINKATTKQIQQNDVSEYHKLGLGQPFMISATTGTGTGDLLDEITKKLPKNDSKTKIRPPSSVLRLPIIGRPNVGKSTLLNYFAREERAIVSQGPHTTRETQEITVQYSPKEKQNKFAYSQNLHQNSHHSYVITLIDTAGIRHKSKIKNPLEKFGVRQSLATFKKSDVILFMIDASQNLAKQDQALARLIKQAGKPVIILANKWDAVKGIEMSEYEKNFQRYFPHLSFAPIIFVSCKNGKNVDKIIDLALEIHSQSAIEIISNDLNKFLKKIMNNIKKFQGKSKTVPRLLDLKQTAIYPPTFEIIMKESKHKKPHPSTIKYIENQLRQEFNLKHAPIKITLRTIKIKP